MRKNIIRVFRVLYTLSLMAFLGSAFLLVYSQVFGLIFAMPDLIVGAEDNLESISILLAATVGIFGYIVFNAEGTKEKSSD